ncbi:uncharacterized protein si:dkey-283b1.6 [Thunnus albacares]|uniref:uncharacterized protein si:dkey-283b1.6 n=1 Tax=Thunnus albacares TaxID=8236 RepID=UPI001CF686A6|nr:uncharacterized protein si:dkey-283b1.6 [Thunnus albacares]
MPFSEIPILEIFLGFLGMGLSIMFCTTFCRACTRLREEQIAREAIRRNDIDGWPPSIYFIPFHSNRSQQDSEDQLGVPRYSEEFHTPPRYSAEVFSGPPPAYNELGFKPDDLPPVYTEYNVPVYPVPPPPPPPPPTDMVQSQTHSHP